MGEQHGPDEGTGQERSPEEAWQEVSQQVEALSDSLARAFRAAWQSEETQRHVRSAEKGLEQVADDIDRAVREAGESHQARKVRAEAERTAGSIREAGERTWKDVRPQVLAGLKGLDAKLRQLIERLEQEPPREAEGPEGGSPDELLDEPDAELEE